MTSRPSSPRSEQQLHRELIELLVRKAAFTHGIEIERAFLELARAVLAERHALPRSRAAIPQLREQSLNLRVAVEACHLLLENEVGAHASGGEVPHAVLILRAVRVTVEMPHAQPLRVLEQLHKEECS